MHIHRIPCLLLLAALPLTASAAITTTQPASAPAATQPGDDAIHGRLRKSKDTYDQEVDIAKKRLTTFFASRIDSAQKQGDLAALKSATATKQSFDTDGTLPDNPPDLATRDNVNSYLFAMRVATRDLSTAYAAAIKDYTRAGMIAQADALQTESDAFQKSSATFARPAPTATTPPAIAATPPAVPIGNGRPFPFSKSSSLPKLFEPNPNVQLSDAGLTFPSLTYLRSTRSDFINLDFTLDVLVTVKSREQLSIGIGPAVAGKTSMAGIRLLSSGMALDEAVGELGKVGPGTHLFRLEKRGPELTTSIVLNYSGKLAPDYKRSGTLHNMRWLTMENSHLFISATGDGIVIKELRISQ